MGLKSHNRQFEPLKWWGKSQRQLKNDEIYKDWYGEPLKRDWVARVVFRIRILLIFLIFRGRSNCSFWDIRPTIHRLLNFNMVFQFLLTEFSKSKLFSSLQKVDHVTNYCKRPIGFLIAELHTRASVAPHLRECRNLPIREILVITWPYVQPTVRPHHRYTKVK